MKNQPKPQLVKEGNKTYSVTYLPKSIIVWKLNDKLHRENGPAIIYGKDKFFYYLNGRQLNRNKWTQEVKKIKYADKLKESCPKCLYFKPDNHEYLILCSKCNNLSNFVEIGV